MKLIKKFLPVRSKAALEIINIIAKHGAKGRIIGGAVRDLLLGLNPSDIDIATNLLPQKIIELFQSHGFKTVPTGLDYGTVTIIMHHQPFEVTTLREDIKCFGRKVEVSFSDSFELDAKRRDFTINAISYCPIQEEIYDYFGGIEDLQNKIVRFIGNADERIKEDYLRILRFFRFSMRFSAEFDPVGLAACVKYKDQLSSLSGERIKMEMDKILGLQSDNYSLAILYDTGILSCLYPSVNYDEDLSKRVILLAKNYNYTNISLLLYAIIFQKTQECVVKKLLDLKFSKKEAIIIKQLVTITQYDFDQLLYECKYRWLNSSEYIPHFIIAHAVSQDDRIYQKFLQLNLMPKPIMPVKAQDIMNLGFTGPNVGNILSNLQRHWIDSDFKLDYNSLINLIKIK